MGAEEQRLGEGALSLQPLEMETACFSEISASTSPLLPFLVTSAPGDGDGMFLRNVGIDLQIHTAPKPKTS
jgi:hypothetical protein